MRNRSCWNVLLTLLLGITISGRRAMPLPIHTIGAPAGQSGAILIRAGTVIDGAGAPRKREDVLVQAGRIAAVGAISPRQGERVIDARGLFVCPGFIDAHSHADGGLMQDPDAETQIRQGITTSVVGQDGSSHYPLASWFAQVEAKHTAINIASFVGHGTIRNLVTGKDYKRHVTPAELSKMRALVAQEMKAGGLGLSTGLEYDPGFYSNTEELIACAKVAGQYGGIYISHVRDEGDKALDSFRELIRIAKEGRLPAQISHIKLDTTPVWGKASVALGLIKRANREGLNITADIYPYNFWESTIIVLIPTRDWSNRAAWKKGLAEVGGASHVLLAVYTPHPSWAGKNIAQIAAETGQDAITTIQQIVAATHGPGASGRETVLVTAMTEPDVDKFIAYPRTMFCTDGGLHFSHPRGAGSYPRMLSRYVRQLHLLTFEQAVHKATGLPAWRFGFADRGRIAAGYRADIVLFNPATVQDTSTVLHPESPPIGLPYVLVNGRIVLDNGRITGERPGMVLRHRASTASTVDSSRDSPRRCATIVPGKRA
ncbi:MAG TPA: D-aminoacylase [Chthonomonadales bacterium]|nr:D-aminoacylase [Chthonomonadales bacterium]